MPSKDTKPCVHQWGAWGYRGVPTYDDGILRVVRHCRCGAKQIRKVTDKEVVNAR